MKQIESILLERRSVRRYERRAVEEEKIDFIYRSIANTPTSYNGQQFSVIAVSDQDTKIKLSETIGQKQIKTCALFLVFCLDYHKINYTARRQGKQPTHYLSTIDGYTVGVIDASLAMMSAVAAAEAQGLGTCCIGYTRTAAPGEVSEILGLPHGVAIVCGLAIGYPGEIPDIKPKLPVNAVVHKERYRTDEGLEREILSYDSLISEYNRTRAGAQTENDWINRILYYHEEALDHGIEDYLKERIGLKVK